MAVWLFVTIFFMITGCDAGTRMCYVCDDCKNMPSDTNQTECTGPCYVKDSGNDVVHRACSLAAELVVYPEIPCFLAMENAEEYTLCYCNDDLCNTAVKVTTPVSMVILTSALSIYLCFPSLM